MKRHEQLESTLSPDVEGSNIMGAELYSGVQGIEGWDADAEVLQLRPWEILAASGGSDMLTTISVKDLRTAEINKPAAIISPDQYSLSTHLKVVTSQGDVRRYVRTRNGWQPFTFPGGKGDEALEVVTAITHKLNLRLRDTAESKQIIIPRLEMPSQADIETKDLRELYEIWLYNHERILKYIEQVGPERIPLFAVHGCTVAQAEFGQAHAVPASVTVKYDVMTRPEDALRALYDADSFALSYALANRGPDEGAMLFADFGYDRAKLENLIPFKRPGWFVE